MFIITQNPPPQQNERAARKERISVLAENTHRKSRLSALGVMQLLKAFSGRA